MSLLAEVDLTVRTYASGAWTDGVYTNGAAVDTAFRGTWRPMPDRQVQLLESGDRERDPRVLYTETRLDVATQHDNQPAAQVSPDGGTTYYEIIAEFDGDTALQTVGIRHWRYRLLRIQEAG
jgi:hypothetical protein